MIAVAALALCGLQAMSEADGADGDSASAPDESDEQALEHTGVTSTPAWLDFSWQWGNDAFPSQRKFFEYAGEARLWWEIRRPFFDTHRQTARLGRWLVKYWGEIDELFRHCGLYAADEVLMSKRQCRARHLAITKYHKGEAVASTAGILVLFFKWRLTQRKGHDKDRANGLMRGFVRQFMTTLDAEELGALCVVDDDIASLCGIDIDEDDEVCGHVAGLFRSPPEDSDMLDKVLLLFGSALARSDECPAVRAWLSDAFPAFCTLLDRGARALRLQRGPLEQLLPLGPSRKRRLDEHYVEALVFATQSPGRASSAAAYSRATGHVSESVGYRGTRRLMAAARCYAWGYFESLQTVVITYDASRWGNPGTDHLAMVAEDPTAQKATVCPPTVKPYSCFVFSRGWGLFSTLSAS